MRRIPEFFARPMALFALAATACLPAQVPASDQRNTTVLNTNTHFAMPRFDNLQAWEAHAKRLRTQILFAAGLDPMPEKRPLNPLIFGRIENKDYSMEKVALETLPGYYLGGNLYRPVGSPGRHPAVASPHGHWSYGRLENQQLASVPARCINLARQGYVVFAYDMVGYTDTVQTPHSFAGPREQLWSFGPLGLQLWNSIRVVDFLTSLPDVDPKRIAATGASGGATQVFLLTAVDDRIKVSAPVNMISAIMQGGSPCENAPGLRFDTSNLEIGALMAPRPMLMVAATGDWTKNTPREEFPAVQSIYRLYGRPGAVESVQIEAPHNYNKQSREAVYRFFAKQMPANAGGSGLAERNVRVEKLGDMLVWHARTLPPNALTYDQIFAEWVRFAKAQNDAISDASAMRDRLRLALATEWPEHVISEEEGDRVVLSRAGKGDRVSATRLGKGIPSVVVVHPSGAQAALEHPLVKDLEKSKKNSALLLTVFQTGDAVAPRNTAAEHFSSFNRNDAQNRVQDILTALAYLKQQGAREVTLIGLDRAAVWCLFAAAVAPTPVNLGGHSENFSGTDEDFIQNFFVPGIQRAGGLAAARRVLGR